MGNKNLHMAKRKKNDEFYTQLSDIENELQYYKKYFKNKIVFCNCDDPEQSNFWQYFARNFEHLQLKKLIATHFDPDKPSYKLELLRLEDGGDQNDDGRIDHLDTIKTPLIQNGDFRSPECIEILKQADIVITNPPFSLFREYVAQLVEYKKKFLIIGNMNAITYKEIFPLIRDNKTWLGCSGMGMKFLTLEGELKNMGFACWFTNLSHKKRNQELILYKSYKENKTDYPKYDNYDAIEVSKTKDIPKDYYGAMGVPISFLDKYCPVQFEILGNSNVRGEREHLMNKVKSATDCTYINGKPQYARILIKRKKKEG